MWLGSRHPQGDVEGLFSSPAKKWGVGIVVALTVVAYGLVTLVLRRPLWLPSGELDRVTLTESVCLGIVCTSLGAFVHFRFFWEDHPVLWRFSQLGQTISLLAFLGTLGFMAVKGLGLL